MIKRRKDSFNREYLYYLMNDIGLLNDYELYEAGVSFDDLENPSWETLDKLEDYRNKRK